LRLSAALGAHNCTAAHFIRDFFNAVNRKKGFLAIEILCGNHSIFMAQRGCSYRTLMQPMCKWAFTPRENTMLNYAVTFFVLAIIAAVLGFGGIAGTLTEIAKLFVIIFAILFVASLVFGMVSGRRSTLPPL